MRESVSLTEALDLIHDGGKITISDMTFFRNSAMLIVAATSNLAPSTRPWMALPSSFLELVSNSV